MTEFEWEEFADDAVEQLRSCINTELQAVEEEHTLLEKLHSWDPITAHLDVDLISDDQMPLHDLKGEITELLFDLRGEIEAGIRQDVKFVNEERHLLEKLQADMQHKDWRAVQKDIEAAEAEEEAFVRMQLHEIKEIQVKFKEIMQLIEKSGLVPEIKEDLSIYKEKHEHDDAIQYYFLALYKFCRAYAKIFEDLHAKEELLLK